MISRFFIDRPIFANVIAIVTILFGVVALYRLPVERYPQITPPTVVVSTNYPGANAQVIADTVAAPIEQAVNGVENMLYMSSTSSADGSYALTITFQIGIDLDQAQVLVQNKVSSAEPLLPEEVRRQGVLVNKRSTNIVLAISLTSPPDPATGKSQYDSVFLSNYATLRLRDELSRVAGVGDVVVRGAGAYAMRIWFDPEKLAARNLTTQDLIAALQEQNVQVAAGAVGQPPGTEGQAFQFTVTSLGRLSEPGQFERIVVKTGEGGRITLLRDVARVELGAQTYDSFSLRDGLEAANILIYQLPGSNAIDVAKGVREAMDRLGQKLPPGVEYTIPFDTTKFVSAAIHEVYATLIAAGVLVLIVILVFLQSWRALLVPATTVPVTIIGAFAFMPFLGFTVNLLTLFGLVLAIGIVVDDAIVIVENASHHIEQGMRPREATIQAMNEVTGPVIAITLVLMAVFIPSAFLTGITGQLYRQFALTIAATALISAINALTLKPAQSAAWLRPHTDREGREVLPRWGVGLMVGFAALYFFGERLIRLAPPVWPAWVGPAQVVVAFGVLGYFLARPVNWLLSGFLRWAFNPVYALAEWVYLFCVRGLVRVGPVVLVAYAALLAVTAVWYWRTPTGFLPTEDQGYVIVNVQLPDAASQDRTRAVINKMKRIIDQTPGIQNWFALGGFSLLDGTNVPNAATVFFVWKDWSERTDPSLSQEALVARLNKEFAQIQEAQIAVLVPPAIQGLGVAGGFQIQVEDREGVGLEQLQGRVQELMGAMKDHPDVLGPAFSTFRAGVPQIYTDIDREKVKSLNVPLSSVFNTLQANLGSFYVNDFNKFGRTYQVRIQAEARFRNRAEDIRRLQVRNAQGRMVPIGTLTRVQRDLGPQAITRYNLYPSASIQGGAAPGASSGDALRAMEEIATAKLPETMGFDWTGISFLERKTGGESLAVYGLAILLVYLVLAAQYESWSLPFAVILVVPLGMLGAVAALSLRNRTGGNFSNDVYAQIGAVLIIALASKNAILIVEFARELRLAGRSIRDAAVQAAKLRFRPILMTSFAFILGVLPLVFATGAGAASRQSLGTAVCGGMLTATVLAVFVVPVFFVVIQWLSELRSGPPKPPADADKVPAVAQVDGHGPDGVNGETKPHAPATQPT